jgi:hypothetical protein
VRTCKTTNAALMKQFDIVAARLAAQLECRWGREFARDVIAWTRRELVDIEPRLPQIGGTRNVFSPVITANGWIVALYRLMSAHGKTPQDVVAVLYDAGDALFARLPRWLSAAARWAVTSRLFRWTMTRQAARSQRRRFPGDFVYRFHGDRDGITFEFEECGVISLYRALDADALAPYCSFFDVLYSRRLGLGLDASRTIGLGCDTCVLAYRPGRDTPVPAALKPVLDQT